MKLYSNYKKIIINNSDRNVDEFLIQSTKGQAMIVATIFFLVVSLTILLGVANPIIRQAQTVRNFTASRNSYFLSEANTEDILYRLKNRLSVGTAQTLTLGGYSSTAIITDVSGGKVITSTANWDSYVRNISAQISAGVGTAFNYGVQVGNGGVVMSNNSGINGNMYSNGNVTGGSGSFVTGSVFAANSSALAADQDNIPDNSPSTSIIFRNTLANKDFAQKFQVSTTDVVNKAQFLIKKVGAPANATVRIVTDSSGSPSTSVITTGTMSASLVTTSFGTVDVAFTSNPQLNAGVDYWLVIDNGSNSSTNYYVLGANNSYAIGFGKLGQFSGAWTTVSPSASSYFKVYIGGLTATISGVTVGTGSVGDAWANKVTGSTVRGNLYCQTGSGNNKSCNTSQQDPAPQSFPISDGNITQWKTESEAGGVINGNYTVDASNASLGPKKIVGNLTLKNGATLTMTGAIWVTGDILISNNASVSLASTFGTNSTILIADGIVDLSNNGQFSGTGQTGSYLMILTTSDCPASPSCSGANAIEVSNNAGAVILNAQKGTVHFSNNSGAKEAVAYTLSLDNGATITYESGLANVNFSTGPSGGWDILSWKEVQ